MFLLFFWKELRLVFFDHQQAWIAGINPKSFHIAFFACLSATILAALQAVGALLVIAVVVIPGACAYLWSDKFEQIIKLSVAIGASTSFVGCYVSYFLDGVTGAIIVLLQSCCFIIALLFAPKKGLLASAKQRKKAKLSMDMTAEEV